MKDRELIRQAKLADAHRDKKGRLPDLKKLPRRKRAHLEGLIRLENEARTVLLEKHAGMIYRLAGRWKARNPRADIEDLAQAGRMGLLHALPKFKESRGVEFLTYASHWVNNFIEIRCLGEYLIQIPVYCWERKEKGKYWGDAQRASSPRALPAGRSQDGEREEVMLAAPGPDRDAFDADDVAELFAALHEMNGSKAAAVVKARFFERTTLEEAGRRVGVGKERARQLQDEALQTLRDLIERRRRRESARLVHCR